MNSIGSAFTALLLAIGGIFGALATSIEGCEPSAQAATFFVTPMTAEEEPGAAYVDWLFVADGFALDVSI